MLAFAIASASIRTATIHSTQTRSRNGGSGAPRPALLRQPRVPEVQERPRLEPAQILAHGLQRVVVAELDAPHVLVEHRRHPPEQRAALLRIGLARHLG